MITQKKLLEKRNRVLSAENSIKDFFLSSTHSSQQKEIQRQRNFLSGKRFEDFEIGQPLGHSTTTFTGFYGANARVYSCSLKKSNEIYAMKVVRNLDEHSHDTQNIKERLAKEAEIAIPFHPHIATCLHSEVGVVDLEENREDFGSNKTAFLIFPYYPRNLRSYLREERENMNNLEILIKLEQLLNAVCHLQTHTISHRDLKPDNVFIRECGKLVIGDFGEYLDCRSGFRFSFPKQMDGFGKGGSTYYLCPEVLTCEGGENRFIDYSKNDVYSVGVIGTAIVQKKNSFKGFRHQNGKKMYKFVGFSEETKRRFDGRVLDLIKRLVEEKFEERLDCFGGWEECKKLLRKMILEKQEEEEEMEGEEVD